MMMHDDTNMTDAASSMMSIIKNSLTGLFQLFLSQLFNRRNSFNLFFGIGRLERAGRQVIRRIELTAAIVLRVPGFRLWH